MNGEKDFVAQLQWWHWWEWARLWQGFYDISKFIIIIVTILIVVISIVGIRLLITWRLSGSEEKPAAFTEYKMSALRLVIMLMAMRRRIKTTTDINHYDGDDEDGSNLKSSQSSYPTYWTTFCCPCMQIYMKLVETWNKQHNCWGSEAFIKLTLEGNFYHKSKMLCFWCVTFITHISAQKRKGWFDVIAISL